MDFKGRFLSGVLDLRLVGLSLVKEVVTEFLTEEAPEEGRGGLGIWTKLTMNSILSLDSAPLGFDVLGSEYDGSLHAFSCNGLEQDFAQKLNTSFNEYGLICEYSQSVTACEYTNREDVGAEPVIWYPFRVDIFPFLAEA